MQVPGDLTGRGAVRRLMAQHERADVQCLAHNAAKRLRRTAIVVAFNPNPVAARHQELQQVAIARVHTLRPAAIMEGVTERDDNVRLQPQHQVQTVVQLHWPVQPVHLPQQVVTVVP